MLPKNPYSSSGFDLIRTLCKVVDRPNPEIDLGPIDMSCTFVVCDAQAEDLPIVYCSPNFENLTGYALDLIMGKNCRFLQDPTGSSQVGRKKHAVDAQAVEHLKCKMLQGRDVQVTLVNYRRGGHPFLNLVSIVPVRGESGEVKFYVGFQIDLVESPSAVTASKKGE